MSVHSLPDRPELDQLRRRAKELRNTARDGVPEALARFAAYRPAGAPVTLAAAQLVIAREHGFASWPQLAAAVEERRMSREQKARALVVASVSGRMDRAARLVEGDPSLATDNVWTAAALGEADHVRALLLGIQGWRLSRTRSRVGRRCWWCATRGGTRSIRCGAQDCGRWPSC